MSRHQTKVTTNKPAAVMIEAVRDRLSRAGFKLIEENTNLWRKGGTMSNPQFVQVHVSPGELRLQAWVRMVLLPGLCVGEFDLEGKFLMVQKRQLKKVLSELEQLA